MKAGGSRSKVAKSASTVQQRYTSSHSSVWFVAIHLATRVVGSFRRAVPLRSTHRVTMSRGKVLRAEDARQREKLTTQITAPIICIPRPGKTYEAFHINVSRPIAVPSFSNTCPPG
jgi:hypothetical protein